MDFNVKQWRDESEEEEQETAATPSAKLPILVLDPQPQQQQLHQSPASSALPLFVPEPTSSNLSAYSSDNSTTTSATKHPRMGSYFNLAQWQELELQAMIFRHMIAGSAVPTELLHLVKKSIISSPPPASPYYICNPLHQYYPHFQPACMDPEPGRCRRTDGKKWRCSRDVVAGQKYCERHLHRGRNRSRKPVEISTSTTTTCGGNAGGRACGQALKTTQGKAAAVGSGTTHFSLLGTSSSVDLPHHNRRHLESTTETKCPFDSQNDGQMGGGRQTLRHFKDDWPRSLHEDNAATNLSISSSDFSLKLGTGNEGTSSTQVASSETDRRQLNWGASWETNPVAAPMGGPLGEAFRSSASTSSPTSVLHRLPRCSASEASYVSSERLC